jgi:hypothetical protein
MGLGDQDHGGGDAEDIADSRRPEHPRRLRLTVIKIIRY